MSGAAQIDGCSGSTLEANLETNLTNSGSGVVVAG